MRGPNGRMITKTFRTQQATQQWERDKLGERDAGTWVGLQSGRIHFGDFVAQRLEDVVDLAPRTRQMSSVLTKAGP